MAFIEMSKIYKVYLPNVVALNGVDLSLERGEIHSIVGENGAGKSTLMRILYGMIKPSSGEIKIDGKKVQISSPSEAMKLGIGMVHQEFMLIPSFKVFENIILGQERSTLGFINRKKAAKTVQEIIDRYGFGVDSNAVVSQLSVAAQQKVEIIKQLYKRATVLILDEPTAVLTPQESDELFEQIMRLKAQGKTIVFISHKLDEVLKISDRITVLRKGQRITTLENKDVNAIELAKMMIGRNLSQISKRESRPGKEVLLIKHLSVKSTRTNKEVLNKVNLSVRAGEIVGIAGVEGKGQYELVQSIVGTIRPYSGEIIVNDTDLTRAPIRERRKLICYVPQDRKYSALALKATILENMIMTHHLKDEFKKGLLALDWKKAYSYAKKAAEQFDILYRSLDEQPEVLSGGNQQKVVVAREFSLGYTLIVLDQPTRGLDIASTEYIRRLILQMRDAGKAILLVSADLDELIQLCDRLYVIKDGNIVAHLDPSKTDIHTIGNYMLGAVN
ncbi:MAG: ABC transporter ATP-binding protein [Pseudothermotoga sp.]